MSLSENRPEPVRFRLTVAILLVVGCVAAPLAVSSIWLRAQVLDTRTYVKTVTPLSVNPAIDAAVADEITKVLFKYVDVPAEARQVLPKKAWFLVLPLSTGLKDYATRAVKEFLGTSQFRTIWQKANQQAHEALVAALDGRRNQFIGPDGSIEIDLAVAIRAAREAIAAAGLHLFDKIQPALLQQRFVIARPASIERVRGWVRVLKTLAIVFSVVALGALAGALGLSRERRRTLLRAGAGLAAGSAAAIVTIVLLRTYYLDEVVGKDVPRTAAGAFFDTIARNLRRDFRYGCYGGIALVGAAVLAGPSPFAVRLRTWALRVAGTIADEAVGESVTAKWVAANKANIRTITVIAGLLLLLSASHPTESFLVKLAVGVVVVLGLTEVLSRPAKPRRGKAA